MNTDPALKILKRTGQALAILAGGAILSHLDDEFLDGNGKALLADGIGSLNDGFTAAVEGLDPQNLIR